MPGLVRDGDVPEMRRPVQLPPLMPSGMGLAMVEGPRGAEFMEYCPPWRALVRTYALDADATG